MCIASCCITAALLCVTMHLEHKSVNTPVSSLQPNDCCLADHAMRLPIPVTIHGALHGTLAHGFAHGLAHGFGNVHYLHMQHHVSIVKCPPPCCRYVLLNGTPVSPTAPADKQLQTWANSMSKWTHLPLDTIAPCVQHFTKLFADSAFVAGIGRLAQVCIRVQCI